MSLRIRTLDELGPEHEAAVAMLRWKAFNDLYGADWVRRRITLGFPYADYGAAYAVDGNEVLAMVEVNRPKLTLRTGVETLGGLAYVCARPTVSRMGLATKLLKDVIAREQAAGIRWMGLFTSRALVAPSLYKRIGFAEVPLGQQTFGFRRIGPKQGLPSGYSAKSPEEKDLESLDLLHDEFARGRLGFASRKKGHLSRWVQVGDLPLSSILMVSKNGSPVAYAVTRSQGNGALGAYEMVAPKPEDMVPLLQAVESSEGRDWFVVGTSPSNVWESVLADRGYVISHDTWGGVFMAMSLGRDLSANEMRHEIGGDDPGFLIHVLDTF